MSLFPARTRILSVANHRAALLGGFPQVGYRGDRRLGAQARRAGAVRGAPGPLRPALRGAQLRAGSTLAPGDGGRGGRPSRRARARRGHGHRTGGPGACAALRMLGDRPRPERRDARRGGAEAGTPSRRSRSASSWSGARRSDSSSPKPSSTTSPSPICCATWTTPRRRSWSLPALSSPAGGRLARVRPPRAADLAAALVALYADRPAVAGPPVRAATGTRWAASWGRASRRCTSGGRWIAVELWASAGISRCAATHELGGGVVTGACAMK